MLNGPKSNEAVTKDYSDIKLGSTSAVSFTIIKLKLEFNTESFL